MEIKKVFQKKDLSVFDPSTGEEISKVVLSDTEDFNKVIKSSNKAKFELGKYFSPSKKSRIII
jgi:NAD-dependent aldehyde dehydrogenases